MKYRCFYYSATGNTARAVAIISSRLAASGSSVDAVKITKGMEAPRIDGYDGVIVAFPVLAFSPPVFVERFIHSLPRAGGTDLGPTGTGGRIPAFVLAVDGGGGGPAAAIAVRLMERRRYQVMLSGKAHYPENWVQASQPPDAADAAALTAQGDAMAASFAEAILSGGGKVERRVSAGSAVLPFLFGFIGRRFLGKLYYADEDCDACGICASQCPAKSIILHKGKRARPYWKLSCEDCNACMNRCPRRAINTSLGRLVVLLGVVVAAAVLGIRGYNAWVRPALDAVMAPALGAAGLLMTMTDIILITAIVLLAHFAIGPVDRYLLRFIQRIPGVRRFFEWTFTKRWRRYRAAAIGE